MSTYPALEGLAVVGIAAPFVVNTVFDQMKTFS